ncbi:tyrosine-type recombinase/integrase [Paenalcaligenes sp. Me52]|uniref:tyrosine-type recombinase/integrase n=1 Tax=Paenalcaligenes sp. Me52 TaxID=3392038 RepID=UPI003D26C037
MRPKLSAVAARQAKPENQPYKLTDGSGLYLLVNKMGKYWRYDYRYQDRRKTLSYGVYPTITLEAARQAHQEAKRVLAEGVDPMYQKKRAKGRKTFAEVAVLWFEHWRSDKSDSTAREAWRRLEVNVFPFIGDVLIEELTAAHVRDCVKRIEARGAADMAKRQLQRCNQIARFAVAHDYAERNPVSDVNPSDILKPRKKQNYARIEPKELPALLQAIDEYQGQAHTRLAMQLMVLTFVRTSELIKAEWSEFDLQALRWEIPAERMKMRTPHIVPLCKQAVEVIQKLQAISMSDSYVFPSDNRRGGHMSNNTILYALYRMGYRSRMTGHGFRGVASTLLHEKGFAHEHIELQLAHQERDEVSASYNHALYLEPRKKMMQWWGDYLYGLRKGNLLDFPVKKIG